MSTVAAVGVDRRAIAAAVERRIPGQLRRLVVVCKGRAELFETSIPWPALAASWREDVALVAAALKEST